MVAAETQTRLRRYLAECALQRKIRSRSWRRDDNNYATIIGQRNYDAHWPPQISTNLLVETLCHTIGNHARTRARFENVRVAMDKGGDAGEKREATARWKVEESRGREVGRTVEIGRTIERRSSCVAGRVSSRRTRDSRHGAMRLVRVLVLRGGMDDRRGAVLQSVGGETPRPTSRCRDYFLSFVHRSRRFSTHLSRVCCTWVTWITRKGHKAEFLEWNAIVQTTAKSVILFEDKLALDRN